MPWQSPSQTPNLASWDSSFPLRRTKASTMEHHGPIRINPTINQLNLKPTRKNKQTRFTRKKSFANGNIIKLTQEVFKNQILKNVDYEYINALEHNITRYLQVKPNDLLHHLWTHYGAIEESDLIANDNGMKAAWNPPTPIEESYKQLRNGQNFAQKQRR